MRALSAAVLALLPACSDAPRVAAPPEGLLLTADRVDRQRRRLASDEVIARRADELRAALPAATVRDREDVLVWLHLNEAAGDGPPPGLDRARPELPLHAILDFHAQLGAAGVELVCVPIPTRVELEPPHADRAYPPPFPAYARGELELLEMLRSEGVGVVDLFSPLALTQSLGVAAHLETDFHWSPAAVAFCAQLLAGWLAGFEWLGPRTLTEGADYALGPPGEPVDTVPPRPPGAAAAGPERVEVQRVRFTDPDFTVKDRSSPLLVMGDSHLTIFEDVEADFGRQLARHLGARFDLIAIPDGAPRMTRRTLARRPEPLSGKRLVVWLFSTRELLREDRWEEIEIPRPAGAAGGSAR